jgi:voltage-gated potassium channel Kch
MSNPGPAITITPNNQNLNSQQAIRLLAVMKAVNVNATGDTALPIISATNYSVSNVVMSGATISLTTAAAGLFTAPGAGGTAIVANAALSGLTGPTIVSQRTVASTTNRTEQTLYFNVATAQGAAATADLYIYGYDLS